MRGESWLIDYSHIGGDVRLYAELQHFLHRRDTKDQVVGYGLVTEDKHVRLKRLCGP